MLKRADAIRHYSGIMIVVRFCFYLMHPSSNDVSFRLFGFPTFIQPFFWLIALFITAVPLGGMNNNMPLWLAQVIVGAAGVLLSILVHELGHALTFRHLFCMPCIIVLHGSGGVTIPQQQHRRGYGFSGAAAECFLAFSGPLAGFVLAFFAIMLLQFVPFPAGNVGTAVALFHFFLWWTALISIFWSIFNLLPIYPMDGGHIAREVFVFLFPRQGVEFSLILSMVLAVFLIAVALQYQQYFIAFILAYFAYQNYLEFSVRSFRR